MWHSITRTAIKKMKYELELWESKANQEVRTSKSRALGVLRMHLVRECRQSLWYIERVVGQKNKKLY
jgi:hypothetical protein